VTEGTRTRVQMYEGVVIGRKGGGIGASFTVRKISFGEGVERVFPLYSTNIDSIDRRAPWPRAPRQAVLPARPSRQIRPDRRGQQLQAQGRRQGLRRRAMKADIHPDYHMIRSR
jgi:hypothetical protein